MLAVTSLARALAGDASLSDVGALSWMMLKQVLPCASMGLFVPDEQNDRVIGGYAAGSHAGLIRGLEAVQVTGSSAGWPGIAGRRSTRNRRSTSASSGAGLEPPLLSALAVPLVHDGILVAVLAVYATTRHRLLRGPRAAARPARAEAGGVDGVGDWPRR